MGEPRMTLAYPLVLIVVTALLSWPVGRLLVRALDAKADPSAAPDRLDRVLVRMLGRRTLEAQGWKAYLRSMLVFNALMFTWAFFVLLLQGHLPLDPDGKTGMKATLAFHTAASFTANTNLQHYAGEQALSYFSQVFALTWLQFVSAATGLACLAALARALGGRGTVGNFIRDTARVTLIVLLPLSLVFGIVLIASGMPMTFDGAAVAHTLEGVTQHIARGPVAAMVAIKQLGTNGGGYFGPNSTHPFENPTYVTEVLENAAIVVIPMACVWMFGALTGRRKHAAILFGVMLLMLLGLALGASVLESAPNPGLAGLGLDPSARNLEGKELRLTVEGGATWAAMTTATSNGFVSAMHDSLNPLTGLMPMIGMWLNSIFGGVGVGLINLFLYVIIAVFIAGLMVGRTPEYLGKKVESREMKLAALALLLHPLLILGGTAVFAATSWGVGTVGNPGSHGFSEILYEMSSAVANNGSGFEGLRDDTAPWNVVTGIFMLLGRYLPIILPLAIAGSLAAKRPVPETAGTLPTDTPTFGLLLLGCVLLLGALLFLPAAVLGPIAEHVALAS